MCMCHFVFLSICFYVNSVSISQKITHYIYFRFQCILLGGEKQFLSPGHVLAIVFLSLSPPPLFCFGGFWGEELSDAGDHLPAYDPQGGDVAEATRVEQPLDVHYWFLI